MNKEISTFIQENKDLIQNTLKQIERKWNTKREWDTIREFWYNKQNSEEKISRFIEQHNKMINSSIKKIKNYNIINEHPILGKCTKEHSFFKSPLYKYMDPTEPQLTKALPAFLKDNPQSAKALIQCLINGPDVNKFSNSEAEFCCRDVKKSPKSKICKQCKLFKDCERCNKRIDNIIYWTNEKEEKGIICIEAKFEAGLYNELKIYKKEIAHLARKKKIENIAYLVISQKREKPPKPWRNILWSDVLKSWEYYIRKYQIKEDEDMKRYRSSLWRKILHWEN